MIALNQVRYKGEGGAYYKAPAATGRGSLDT
jgi:hypothetical protein